MSGNDAPPPYQPMPAQGYGAGMMPQQPAGAVPPSQPGYMDPSKYPAGYNNPGVPAGGYTNPGGPPQQYQSYQQYGVVVQQQPNPQVVIVGGCPACRVGVLEEDYTCLGVLCAILFFPLGILCCLAMRQRRCPNCGAVFD